MACPKDMDLEANAIVGYIYIFLEKLPTKNLKDIYIYIYIYIYISM